jgi:outer membrane lipoprotein-sorting protein
VPILLSAFTGKPLSKGDEVKSQFPLTDFRMGADEKVDGRPAKVVHYRLGPKGTGTAYTLWLDSKTLLPMKRYSVLDENPSTVTEVYREFTLEPKVDVSAFDLPK